MKLTARLGMRMPLPTITLIVSHVHRPYSRSRLVLSYDDEKCHARNIILSRETFCRSKNNFVATIDVFCHAKHVHLSRQ